MPWSTQASPIARSKSNAIRNRRRRDHEQEASTYRGGWGAGRGRNRRQRRLRDDSPGNVYSACLLKSVGTIRLIDKSLPATNLMSRCTDKETEVSWNQAGQPGAPGAPGAKGEPGAPGKDGANGTSGADGKDGVSVTTASEPAGANCVDGGVQVTASNGVSYACNGQDGADGNDGVKGADGRDGASVANAAEPPGANCASGGSRLSVGDGAATFACNGAPG